MKSSPHTSPQGLIEQARTLVIQDRLEDVMELLRPHYQPDPRFNDLLLQLIRYKELKRADMAGTMPPDQVTLEVNQIRLNVLTFLQELEADFPKLATAPSAPSAYPAVFAASLARIKVASLLLERHKRALPTQGYTITELTSRLHPTKRKLVVASLQEMEGAKLVRKEKIAKQVRWSLNESGVELFDGMM